MAPLAARRASLWWSRRSPRNDQPLTWSGPEGSSHSGDIVCRGVAAGAASITPRIIRRVSHRQFLPGSVSGEAVSVGFIYMQSKAAAQQWTCPLFTTPLVRE
jgi:hypothetical protein